MGRRIHYYQLQKKWGKPTFIFVETNRYDRYISKIDGKEYRIYKEFSVDEKDIDFMPTLTPLTYFKTYFDKDCNLNYLNEILFK